MDKKTVIRFLKEKRRGAYTLLVDVYADVAASMAITLALTVIKEDLERESGSNIDLHYFSFAKAVARFKKKNVTMHGAVSQRKREFKDANEINDSQLSPGRFKLG